MTVQALQDELRIQRDLNQLFQQDPASHVRELALTSEPTEENYRRLQAEHERQAKELFLLRKTLEEMELRIDTQKQTLGARDESIKKLLEMLQSKGRTSGVFTLFPLSDSESWFLDKIDGKVFNLFRFILKC